MPAMLKFLRNKSIQKRLFLGLAIGIIPSFVIWGVMVESTPGGAGAEAGKIGRKSISTGDFIKQYEAFRNEISVFHGIDPAKLEGQMDFEKATWERILVLNAAKDLKIGTSDEEVLAWLAQQKSFHTNGKFDQSMYRFFIERQLKTTAREFEESIRSMLTLRKVIDVFSPPFEPGEDDIRKLFRERFASRHLRYAVFAADASSPEPVIDEKEVENLYESMKHVLIHPEAVNVLYVYLPKEPDKNTEEVRTALASAGPEKAADHGLESKESGFLTRQSPFPEAGYSEKLTQAVFALAKEGDLAPWIETEKGHVLARLVKKRATEPIPLEEAKTDIRKHLVQGELDKKVRERADAFRAAAAEKGFDQAAQEAGITVLDAPAYKRGEYLDKAGPLAAQFDETIAPLAAGQTADPIKTPNGFAVIKVETIADPSEEEWAKEKDVLKKEIAKKAMSESFGKKMDALWAKLRINYETMKALFPQKYGSENSVKN